ncbi:hypothetical protein [uncultured Methylobacterium sp.]|uniref:relaxase/mobilization nuclease domain-containing protein n=1 Tax=uncultured Methylobacterium sp. TaxID=157278 RepID=UPI002592C85E|nr:hypothetical protein [uncultured Methylobacterium sp.]
MISGSMRGKGGRALSAHLLKAENEVVRVITPRGLGSADLHAQMEELVALSLGGRTGQPVYHVHVDPELTVTDNPGARAVWWKLFEAEFGLTQQPYCGAEHVKHGRAHEHRCYSLVRPSGQVVNLAFDFARREKVSRIVEHAYGKPAVRSKHARAIERRLREDGRHDVADWLAASGTLVAERPVARVTPQERLIEERTGVSLDDLRTAALAAWTASSDGEGFLAALHERGLDLRQGRSGPVVVDRTGTAHLTTRLIGAAARRADGSRIPAAEVKARLAVLTLKDHGADDGQQVGRAHERGAVAAAADGGPRDGLGAGRDARGEVPHRDADGAHGDRGRSDWGRVGDALRRVEARPGEALLRGRLRLMGPARNRALADALDGVRARRWIAVPGQTDMWGLPLQGERPRLG